MSEDDLRLEWARYVFAREDVTQGEIDQAAGMMGFRVYVFRVRVAELEAEVGVSLRRSWLGRVLVRVLGL